MEDEFDRLRAETHFLPRTDELIATQNLSKFLQIDGHGTNVAFHGLTAAPATCVAAMRQP